MSKEKKKTIIFTIILAVVAIALLAVFVVMELRESGTIGSGDSSEIMQEFEENFNSKERTVIYFASPTCSACMLQTPILEEIADEYDMDYYYLDSSQLSNSQRKEVTETLDIESATPTTVIVENGKVIDALVGYKPGKEYVEFLVEGEILPEDAEYSGEKYITYVDYSEYEELISDNGTHIIVIGQTSCSHCIAIKPALNSVAEDYEVTINYLNLTDLTEDESNSFFESLTTIQYDDPDFVEKGSFGTPLTLIIEDGKVLDYISGERTKSQLVREFKKLGLISE